MNRRCEQCGDEYDDVPQSTLCPHDPIWTHQGIPSPDPAACACRGVAPHYRYHSPESCGVLSPVELDTMRQLPIGRERAAYVREVLS